MKIKLCLIGVRLWEKHNDLTGETLKCAFYQAFNEKGQPMEFKSNIEDYPTHEVLKYDDKLAKEYDIKAVFDSFKGKMKYVELE